LDQKIRRATGARFVGVPVDISKDSTYWLGLYKSHKANVLQSGTQTQA